MGHIPKSTRIPPPPPSPECIVVRLTEEEARTVCVALAIAEPENEDKYTSQLDIRKKILKARNEFAALRMERVIKA